MYKTPVVLFFHGLNTFGDDLLHLGPVNLGRMDRHLKPALEDRGLKFISLNNIGAGSPEVQAAACALQIATLAELEDGSNVVLLGNSMGGLVARALATLWQNREGNPKKLNIEKLISWGTPHRGTPLADLAVEFPKRNPLITKSLARLGYHLGKNVDTFSHYTPSKLDEFNLRHPLRTVPSEHSFICAVPVSEVSPYFWTFYRFLHGGPTSELARRALSKTDFFAPSDGFITIGSQGWGERYGPYSLDHFGQTGFFSILPRPVSRRRACNEFNRLCDDIADLIKN